MSLISVIIPTYNAEKTIRETIKSVLEQTWQTFEIIVINDGSTDSTLEIIESLQDERIKVFSYENAGLAASRNRGITQAQGEYIAFLDADDLWKPNKLEAQYQALQSHPEAAVAYSWTDYINERGEFLYPGSHITADGNVYEKLFIQNFIENGSNPLIRRQALAEVGEFDGLSNSAADWDMWLRLAARYHFITVRSPQILYRLSTTSMSSQLSRQEAEGLRVIENTLSRTPERLQPLKKQSLAYLYRYLLFRGLEGHLTRIGSLQVAHYFFKVIRNQPNFLFQESRLMAVVAVKISLSILLGKTQVERIVNFLKA